MTAVTSNKIAVFWTAPDSTQNALFKQYILHWVDLSTGRGHSIRLDKMNQSAVIGGLKAYHAYKITVLTVTAQDVESNDSTSMTVFTGRFCKKNKVCWRYLGVNSLLFAVLPFKTICLINILTIAQFNKNTIHIIALCNAYLN